MGMTMSRAYLDACVAIYFVEQHPTLGPRVEAALFPPTGPQVTPVISDLTRLECRVLPMRNQEHGLIARYDTFFNLPDCDCAALDAATFDLATELRALYALKTPDALHLAAAIRSGCREFWTHDGRLAKAAANRIRVIVF